VLGQDMVAYKVTRTRARAGRQPPARSTTPRSTRASGSPPSPAPLFEYVVQNKNEKGGFDVKGC
jgi:hypothetical protein